MAKSWRRAMQSRRLGCAFLGWKGDDNVYVPRRGATRRQIGYIQGLRAKAGRVPLTDQEAGSMSITEAYDMIERLTGVL